MDVFAYCLSLQFRHYLSVRSILLDRIQQGLNRPEHMVIVCRELQLTVTMDHGVVPGRCPATSGYQLEDT
jgi:hypothetical protein